MDDTPLPLIDFAAKLGVDPLTVRRWHWDGLRGGAVKLAVVRVGVKVFVRWADYLDFQRRFDTWQPKAPTVVSSRARRRNDRETQAWLAARGMA